MGEGRAADGRAQQSGRADREAPGADAGSAVAVIESFSGEHRFLSNFWPATVQFDGETYPSVEHAYQAAKTSDRAARRTVREAPGPAAAKRLGATVPLDPGWDEHRIPVMRDLLRQKFAHPELGARLLGTGSTVLIEGNDWGDRFWGVDGTGTNHLGNLLMAERDRLRGAPAPDLALDLSALTALAALPTPGQDIGAGGPHPGADLHDLHDLLAWAETRFARRLLVAVPPHDDVHAIVADLTASGAAPPSLTETPVLAPVDLAAAAAEPAPLVIVTDDATILDVTAVPGGRTHHLVPVPHGDPASGRSGFVATALRHDLDHLLATLDR